MGGRKREGRAVATLNFGKVLTTQQTWELTEQLPVKWAGVLLQ